MPKIWGEAEIMTMRRWQKWLMILTIGCLLTIGTVQLTNDARALGFKDVHGHWAEQTIGQMMDQGLLDGFPDETFRPDEKVTADQFVKIVLLAYTDKFPNGERKWKGSFVQALSASNQNILGQDYRDFTFKPSTTGYWAKPYLDLASDLHFISKGQFSDYKAALKREDVAEILYYLMKETEYLEDETYSLGAAAHFGDLQSATSRGQKFIGEAVAKGLMEGYPNGYFGVGQYVTRAEALEIISRLQNKAKRIVVKNENGTLLKVVPTKDGSYKKIVFPDQRMLDAYGVMESAGKLRGTNYDLEETTLRLFKDAAAKALAKNGATAEARNSNEVSLWLDPQFATYGVTVRLEDGALARNTESIRTFTDFLFGYDADIFNRLFTDACNRAAAKGVLETTTTSIGSYSVETRLEWDGKTIIFSIIHT
ncbi:S-layer homology domain-containing protein [Paenibacillus roseipurpureus]|uniref:S-layer homology domain-containing protein n=1 Tax=Paenibacillus roseopurpureus TaxID=2918901 RepID=A0AA96LNE7_9BACL|nr:S-layer homology domain-containing protein [Paenibacillus sp. MBLB1832]WNR44955.1 S-layer homology domain-containing protein [Paenibacillus sp. MBLB1832]